jgi:hypothetical protein
MYLADARHPLALQVIEGTSQQAVISTGAFSDDLCGVSTGLRALSASSRPHLIVPSIWQAPDGTTFRLTVYSDKPVVVQAL